VAISVLHRGCPVSVSASSSVWVIGRLLTRAVLLGRSLADLGFRARFNFEERRRSGRNSPARRTAPHRLQHVQKSGWRIATTFVLFLCFQGLPFSNLGCSAATFPGLTCHLSSRCRRHRYNQSVRSCPELGASAPPLRVVALFRTARIGRSPS